MEISWYGLSCFRLSERQHATVLTDPYDGAKVGLPALKAKADVVTISHAAAGHSYTQGITGFEHALDGPGEYEIGNVFITGIATPSENGAAPNVIYLFDFQGFKVAHLGDMISVPSQAQIEDLEMVNVLLVPVGGGNSLNAAKAAEIVSMIEPEIVIPMHYQRPGLKLDLEPVERFLAEMGVTDVQEESSLRISAGSTPEETQVVLLTPRGES